MRKARRPRKRHLFSCLRHISRARGFHRSEEPVVLMCPIAGGVLMLCRSGSHNLHRCLAPLVAWFGAECIFCMVVMPTSRTIPCLLDELAVRFPEREALVGGGRR